jgi:hypothetical protein
MRESGIAARASIAPRAVPRTIATMIRPAERRASGVDFGMG